MKVSHLLAAVVILGLAGGFAVAKEAKGDKKAPKGPKGLIGKVVSVTGTDVTVKTKSGEVVVKTDASTTVTIDGVEGKAVADLTAGMMVAVTPETGTATKIIAKTAAAHKKDGKKKKPE